MAPVIPPSSKTWTLRFKLHRTTILLLVDPLQTLSSVRAELLKAVQQTHPDGKVDGHAIPKVAHDVLLARPVDVNHLGAGWERLDGEDGADLFDEKGKGKGKATAGSRNRQKKEGSAQDCPQGMGLRDGGIVAFKFRYEEGMPAEKYQEESEGGDGDEDGEKLDSETFVREPELELWDVVVPTMEDTYGDVGQHGMASV